MEPDETAAPIPPPIPPIQAVTPQPGAWPMVPMPYPAAQWTPPKPRVWPVFVNFLAALIVSQILAAIGLIAVVAIQSRGQAFVEANKIQQVVENAERVPWVLFAVLAFPVSATLAAAAMIGAKLSPVLMVRRLRMGPTRISMISYIIIIVGALAASETASSAITLMGLRHTGALKMLDEVFRHLRGWSLAFGILEVGVIAGFCEELFFRGYCQSRLIERWGPAVGILVASLLFGIMHMDPVHSLFAFAFGIYLGFIAHRVGSIRPSIASHIVNNIVAILPGTLAIAPWLGLTVSLVVLVLCLTYVMAKVQRDSDAGQPPPIPEMPAPATIAPDAGWHG